MKFVALTPLQRAEWKLTRSRVLIFAAMPLTLPFAAVAILFLAIGATLLLPALVVSKAARRLYDAGCVDWHRAKMEKQR